MYIVTRRYKLGKYPVKEVIERTQKAFTPLLENMDGFHDYYFLHSDSSVMTIGVFESRAEAEESTRMAAEYIEKNVPDLYAGPPEIFSGEVKVHVQKSEEASGRRHVGGPPEHASI